MQKEEIKTDDLYDNVRNIDQLSDKNFVRRLREDMMYFDENMRKRIAKLEALASKDSSQDIAVLKYQLEQQIEINKLQTKINKLLSLGVALLSIAAIAGMVA
ncbi:MAG: hypothetical protein N0C90_12910 [Candidatus Thiodiazotropha endolucinida]|nr:hypothetical protein [Candidatus Thiodiazotropha taylori]MCW4262261.1 hypothetical protein [Candidatus Thiodiazotropha endolucinida]